MSYDRAWREKEIEVVWADKELADSWVDTATRVVEMGLRGAEDREAKEWALQHEIGHIKFADELYDRLGEGDELQRRLDNPTKRERYISEFMADAHTIKKLGWRGAMRGLLSVYKDHTWHRGDVDISSHPSWARRLSALRSGVCDLNLNNYYSWTEESAEAIKEII